MPHTILEYSANLEDQPDLQLFFQQLHTFLVEAAPCRLQDLKSRAYRCDEYRMADGQDAMAFAHLAINIFEGRTPEVLARMGQGALDLMREHFPLTLARRQADLTVEIRGMRKDAYFKASSVKVP